MTTLCEMHNVDSNKTYQQLDYTIPRTFDRQISPTNDYLPYMNTSLYHILWEGLVPSRIGDNTNLFEKCVWQFTIGGCTIWRQRLGGGTNARSNASRRRVRSACATRPPLRHRHYKFPTIPRNLWERCQRHPRPSASTGYRLATCLLRFRTRNGRRKFDYPFQNAIPI